MPGDFHSLDLSCLDPGASVPQHCPMTSTAHLLWDAIESAWELLQACLSPRPLATPVFSAPSAVKLPQETVPHIRGETRLDPDAEGAVEAHAFDRGSRPSPFVAALFAGLFLTLAFALLASF